MCSIQKEMGKPEDGLATTVMPVPTGVEMGGSCTSRRTRGAALTWTPETGPG